MSSGPVVLVTGGSAGIGEAIVDVLLKEGARLVLVDLAEAPLIARQKEYTTDRIQYIVGDVGKDETNIAAVQKAIDVWGRLDALALNAGTMAPVHRLAGSSAAAWQKIFSINVVAHVSALSVAIPHLRETKGRVIFTTSDAGEKPTFAAWGAYGATKAAVNYVIKVLKLEEPDITCVGVYPGVADTPMVKDLFGGIYLSGMTKEELENYTKIVTPRLVAPALPGTVIANLALKAEPVLHGEILFWNDDRLKEYAP